MLPTTVRNRFFSVLDDTEKRISEFVYKPGADMTRHRCCPFKDIVLATMSMTMSRTNTELLRYFGISDRQIPSKSAFTQQRKKLKPEAFSHMLQAFNEAIPFSKTFHGYHLIAVDGSDINLPTDKNDFTYRITQSSGKWYYYQMHLNALYDICENRYVSALITPRPQMDERGALYQMIKEGSFPDNTIFIADRGYPSNNLCANLTAHNKLFLFRVVSPSSPASMIKGLLAPGVETDKICSIGLSRSRKVLHCNNFDKVIRLRPDRQFDVIAQDDKTSVYSMSLRVTCIKLDEGSYEYLISNLPMDVFPASVLKEMYWKRWRIETSFRNLKYALSLVYLHSVNRELIMQEIYAKMILYNFTSLIHAYAERCNAMSDQSKQHKQRKNTYKVSFENAVPIARELLSHYIKNDIIKALLLKYLTTVKMKAVSPRHMRSQTVKTLNNRA